jgi:murein tripeptide amidase MpaA
VKIAVSSTFDGGAIELVRADSADDIEVRIRKDVQADFAQWFYFRLSGARGEQVRIRFSNAAACTYPRGWDNYAVVASYDRRDWWRVPTSFKDGVLEIEQHIEADQIYYAYFEPYRHDRHLDLIAVCQLKPNVSVERLALTAQGRDVDSINIGQGPAQVWVIARQHPGETMAEWFVEGMIERLLVQGDDKVEQLLKLATFRLVPNMNPDGSALGNLRTNATGANLNREWFEPSMLRSPEVMGVRDAMIEKGVHLFVDAHGDEALPYVFVSGCEMLPTFNEQQRLAQQAFIDDFKAASPEFQDKVGYPVGRYQQDALKLASKWVGNRFGCVSLTLEMPFKDNAHRPDPAVGWNGERSKQLGAAILEPMLNTLKAQAGK